MGSNLSQLENTHVYRTESTLADLRRDIAAIKELDKDAEGKQKRMVIGIVLSGLAIPLGLIGLAVTEMPALLAISGLGLIGMITFIVLYYNAGKGNFEDRRYLLLEKAVELLGKDMAADAPVSLRLNLDKADARAKLVRSGKVGLWDTDFYEDPWLDLRGRFLDGTAFNMLMTEKTQHRSRWARSMSGKSKHKTKTKVAHSMLVRLKAKPEKYGHIERLADTANTAVQLPPWVETKSLAVEGGTFVLKSSSKWNDWLVPIEDAKPPVRDGVHWVAMMFLSLYQVLNLSRTMTKAVG